MVQDPKNPWIYPNGFIKAIGYISQLAFTCPPKVDATRSNLDMVRRVMSVFPDADLTKYGKIQGNFCSVMKGLAKYDNDATFKITPEERELAVETYKLMFPELEEYFVALSDYEVLQKMPTSTSGGAVMALLKLKTKLEALVKYLPQIMCLAKSLEHIPLFRGSGKAERIIREKIIKEDVRLFITAPIEFVWKGMMLFGHFSEYLVEKAEEPLSPIKIGMAMIHNSLLGFFNRISKLNWKIASDVSKWDGRYLNEFFEMICEIKIWMHSKTDSMPHSDYEAQVRHYYEILKRPFVAMPDGNIYKLKKGQMSGVFTTSQDNSLAHVLIMIIVLLRHFGQKRLLQLWKSNSIEIGIVGDDNCSGIPEEISFEEREKAYSDCGMILKPAMEFSSSSAENITFLSFTFKEGKIFFDRDKILCSIVHEPLPNINDKRAIDRYVSRIGNFVILCPFDEVLCQFIINLYNELRKKYEIKSPPPYPMSVDYLQKLWTGGEAAFHLAKLL